jgi:hypothetical protein
MSGEVTTICIVGLVLTYSLVKTAIKANAIGPGRRQDIDDTRMVQDIHRQLEHIEQRVDALETILMDREATQEKKSN